MNKTEILWQMQELEQKSLKLDTNRWIEYEFLTWDWWMLVAFLVIPWALFFRFSDKTKMVEILLFGFITLFFTSVLDIVGTLLQFWVYSVELLPGLPRAFPFDVGMVPVAFMFLHQWFKTWKFFSIALILMAATFAFIGEPFANWVGIAFYIKWKYIYSLAYYMLVGLGVRALIIKLRAMSGAA